MVSLTPERLREVLSYNPDTGIFVWRRKLNRSMRVGSRAGGLKPGGYRRIVIDKVGYAEHRLALLYVTGAWPAEQVDHRRGVRDDNRFAELRPASHGENMRNRKRQANNTSGFRGVCRYSHTNRWRANIRLNGTRRFLGSFATPEAASQAYEAAATELFGEFKRAA